ncbi:MAG: 2-succinyl-5-enolpyruvyl-6-hydroxy-3-cyclohexene-1-carboxylic-acid synthase [Bacteroidota bacterium]
MAVLQPIIDIVEICALRGIKRVILCPGSRSAPLTLAFARNPKITCYSISDERSAGFMALGMALQTKEIVAIVCTSGSAVYNFAPAVVEAFFQEVPILVFSADRPIEWIHQNDGQTIYQQNIFGTNVKKSYQLAADYTHADTAWFMNRCMNEAISICLEAPFGPVHINIPIREPFYPTENEIIKPSDKAKAVLRMGPIYTISSEDKAELFSKLKSFDKILIACGQMELDMELSETLGKIQEELQIPILADLISNVKMAHIQHHDSFLSIDNEDFIPELLITCGKSFISKSFKKYFQHHKPIAHWHIQIGAHLIDPLQSIDTIIPMTAESFFKEMFGEMDFQNFKSGEEDRPSDYLSVWQAAERKANKVKNDFIKNADTFSEIVAYDTVLDCLSDSCELHVANSMAVRYANLLGIDHDKNINVFANRGTSGIDGCLSTAVGSAILTDQLTISLIGDVAFFYDRNALWNNYLPSNLRIIVFNNNGGGIFRLIDGPNVQPELNEFFETEQKQSAKRTVEDSGLLYFRADNLKDLMLILPSFMLNDGQPKCLEIATTGELNQEVFKQFKLSFKA